LTDLNREIRGGALAEIPVMSRRRGLQGQASEDHRGGDLSPKLWCELAIRCQVV